LLAALALARLAHAEQPPQMLDEYQVKAAFLYNFAKFVEWPPQVFSSAAEPISICVLGPDPFGATLRETVSGKDVSGRPFLVRPLQDVRQVAGCRILFVSSSERGVLSSILAGTKTTGVLTVGETESFLRQGGIINFKIDGGKVRFAINLDAAQQAGIRVSSKLLSLAETVRK